MLKRNLKRGIIEAGCDEAGRGCLAGPVFAAAVILPPGFRNSLLNDSKQLQEEDRYKLRKIIESKALAWAVASCDNVEIDDINILNASFLAMHRAIAQLKVTPQLLVIDGNRFNPYGNIPHQCVIDGDEIFMHVAAASILAKTYRDDHMKVMDKKYPHYNWASNKGYPTPEHREAIHIHGITELHRKTFGTVALQLEEEK